MWTLKFVKKRNVAINDSNHNNLEWFPFKSGFTLKCLVKEITLRWYGMALISIWMLDYCMPYILEIQGEPCPFLQWDYLTKL